MPRRRLRRYAHSLPTQISQTAACNRLRAVDARRARWLPVTRDRLPSDEFRLTRELVSDMPGVRREGVNRAAVLRRNEPIGYGRGHIRTLDRAGLEAVSCECYRVVGEESDGAAAEGAEGARS